MSNKYHAKPIVAKNSTRPGESSEYVGTRNTTELLPAIFQTSVNKRFLDSTLEQLMSTGSLEAINFYLGNNNSRDVSTDRFLNDNRTADRYQFTPGSVVRDDEENITQAMSYDDFLRILKYNEVDVTNTNRIFNEPGYTLDLPLNYDMFINYHHHFWLLDFMPMCEVNATVGDPITITSIVGQPYYTTPTLSNGKTLVLQNGMRVKFTGANVTGTVDYPVDDIFIVDGVGTSIALTKQFENTGSANYGKRVWFNDTIYGVQEPSQWDGNDNDFVFPTYDLTTYEVLSRDYVVEQRHTQDQSVWSRRNLWLHEEVVAAICTYNDLNVSDYTLDKFRGVRPIIEFRANIEKYNYATTSLGGVTHVFDNINEPLYQIPVGATNWNLADQSINLFWDEQGYEFGTSVRLLSNSVTTYWNCIKTHTTSKNPSYSENASYWKKVQARNLENNDTILFLNAAEPYNNNIYTVQVDGSSAVTALTQTYGPSSTALAAGNGINVRIGYNNVFGEDYPNNIYSGSEWYWTGTAWTYSQQKTNRSQGIKFNLYDSNSVLLSNETTYPNSNFAGDNIFNYGTADTPVDTALGISPRYVDYGNTPGISFDIGLGSVRYMYNDLNTDAKPENNDSSNLNSIVGYYYYKKLDDTQYYNGWVELRNQQPVKKHAQRVITDASTPIVINIGTTNVLADNAFEITKRNSKLEFYSFRNDADSKLARINGLNPSLFVDRTKSYIFSTTFDSSDLEFVNPDGTVLSNVTVTNSGTNEKTLTVANLFTADSIRYRLVSDNTVTGLIYVNSDSISDNIKVTKNGVDVTVYGFTGGKVSISNALFAVDDVIDVEWSSDSKITSSDGVDAPADTHVLNSKNELLTQVSFGDILSHMKQQMTGIPGLVGNFYGVNNYRLLPAVHEFGGTIRQQPYSTELFAQSLMHNDTNIFSSIKHASNSYKGFKKQFLTKCKQLHNTMDSSVSAITIVDQALASINVGKNKNDIFANSNMLKYKGYEEINNSWTAADNPVFTLPNSINTYDDTENHIQVFVRDADGTTNRWRSLVKDVDYTLTKNKVTVTASVSFDSAGRALINVRWYPLNSPSFVPPSAVKLGLVRPYVPTVTASEICGHDGSKITRKGTELYDRNKAGFNIEDAVLFDFETRVYNNLLSASIVDYKTIMPNASRKTVYNWADLNATLLTSFQKYSATEKLGSIHDASLYAVGDKFTWNYSDVSPFIGGWRGIYTYYFNTTRPHTHPWEMFGYNKKPTWWDTNYSWTDAGKRTAFIAALKTGHTNNPALAAKYDMTYAYTAYDWDTNTLVTNAGVLNDPDTANVVATPTDSAIPFVFGDWGTVENNWRDSSAYKISLFLGLAKLRPLSVINNYFRSNTRTQYEFNTVTVAFSDTKWLGNNTANKLSNQSYDDNIIEFVTVKNGGNSYASAPALDVYSNFGTGATLTTEITGGVVTGVAVTNPGSNYQTKPSIVPVSGSATFDVMLSADNSKYIAGLSNAIVNYAQYSGTTVDTLANRLKNYNTNLIVKAGGFINTNQELILESSQDKGRVNIPEENINTILYTSQPKDEKFYGAIKVTKVSNGYSVAGFDSSKNFFTYFKPRTELAKVLVEVGSTNVFKYKFWEDTESTLNYETVLNTIQDVYTFILGYGDYLQSEGWNDTWASTAGNLVIWAETAKLSEISYAMPSTTTIEVLETTSGYYTDINSKFDGENNVVDLNGRQIPNNKLLITRDVNNNVDGKTTVVATDGAAIYGLRLYRVELEHAMIIDNESNFDDLIYSPALGLRHQRVIWRGSRTKDWNGKLHAPGYIVNGNSVMPNFDTVAGEIDKYYGPGNTLSNQQQVDTARFNVGYNKPDWNLTVGLDDDTLFNFVKGTRKYKGTRHALNAFMRNTSLFGTLATAKVNEEWAIRTADYGDTRSRNTLEFSIDKSLLKTNPQPVRFSSTEFNDVLSDIVIDVDFNSPLLVTGTPGDNFTTRLPKTFNYTTISNEATYANDFISAGLPLLTEADYRTLNKEDFEQFPLVTKADYSFDGDWQDIEQWNNNEAYKFKDRVIYAGRVWEMLDPDGTSGLTRPNDVIGITGTQTLPTIPNSGETLVIDGNTINLQQTTNTTTFGVIRVTGTNNILTTPAVTDASSLIIGTTSTTATTIVFNSTTSSIVFNDASIVGDVISPQIDGAANKELVIESTSILFNETESLTSNITSQTAFEQMFFDAFESGVNTPAIRASVATTRVQRIDAFRTAYISATDQASYDTVLTNYFANSPVGLEFTVLLALDAPTAPAYQAALHALITNDVDLVNNSLGTTYNAINVIDGTETVTPANISSAQADLDDSALPEAIRDWLVANSGTAFTVSTIVSTTNTNQFKTYNLTEIVDRINGVGIANVTASNSGNRLAITKTTTTPSIEFTLTVSVDTANAEVGFSTVGPTTVTSSGSTVTNSPNLTLTQVISAINNTNISGITASAGGANNNVLQLNSSNETLYIGAGSANAAIGLSVGVETAPVTTTTVSTSTDLAATIDIINNAAVASVTASNSNNRLKLTSTNSTLTIGAGTANTTLGLTAQILTATQTSVSNVFNAFVGSDGNQVFQQMENDPNVFSIWVADSKENSSGSSSGYSVYQTMDFGMYITKACAGIVDSDDAQVTIKIADSTAQAHGLAIGDYVYISGSNTVPSIDGVHQVTAEDSASNLIFYIDEYIQEEGNLGNVYPLRNVRFASFSSLDANYNTTVDGVFKYNFAGLRQNNQQTPKLAFVDDDGTGSPAVYRFTGSFTNNTGHTGAEGWTKIRTSGNQARNDLIENVKLYDALTRSVITQLEVFDPAKGIIPGFISEEIDLILTADIATYNYNTIDGYSESTRSWNSEQVGTRWWDIKTAVYLDYEQSSIDYKQAYWGKLFDGSSIDIYEWTRSSVLPEEWVDLVDRNGVIDGQTASGSPLSIVIDEENVYQWSEESYYNSRTRRTETSYYFWVKNKLSSFGQRNYNTYQLAQLLKDPTAFDISWAAAAGSSELIVANIEQFVTQNTVVQVNQQFDSNALPLSEWTLLAENDPISIIPEQLHIKIRDSLTGYNRHTDRYTFSDYSSVAVYAENVVVKEGDNYYISVVADNTNVLPSTNTTSSNWSKIYDYTLPEGTPENDIDIIRPHALPDLDLHEYNRYGHLTRPRQSLVRDLITARQNFVETANKLLADINIVEEISHWDTVLGSTYVEGEVTYNISSYWTYTDYVRKTYDTNDTLTYQYDTSSIPLYTATSKDELYGELGVPFLYVNGDTLKITNVMHSDGVNRPETYTRIDNEWVLEHKENSTIKLSEELWNNEKYGLGFDLAGFDTNTFDSSVDGIISRVIDELKNRIFTGRHTVKYNKLWFKCLYQAVADNTVDDFAFKTTYVKLNVDHPLLTSKEKYGNYSVGVIEEFFNTIKPFHTKLHSTVDSNTHTDSWENEITEHDRKANITMKYEDHTERTWAGDTILSGGTFATAPDNVDAITFTTVDGDIEYIYDANVFQQAVLEGWGRELYPMDVMENISILVQTNASGSAETTDTRSFRMNIWEQYRIQESTVIVDATSTVTTTVAFRADTTIVVNDATNLPDSGVVWMGNERIEYGAKDDNFVVGGLLFYCTRGTYGTPVLTDTPIGTTVRYEPRIPVLENFGHYGDNLRLAYNDSGISLAASGTTPEHEFIRNAGSGTL